MHSGDFGNEPVCVGPFEFVERVVGDHTTLQRSEDYYDKDNVYLDTIIYRLVTDETVRTANLRSGDLQVVDRLATTDVEGLRSDPAFTVLDKVSNAYTFMTFNIANANGIAEPPGEVDSPFVDASCVKRSTWRSTATRSTRSCTAACRCPDAGRSRRQARTPTVAPPATRPRASPGAGGRIRPAHPDHRRAQDALYAGQHPARRAPAVAGRGGGFDLQIVPLENTTAFDDQTNGDFQMMLGRWSGRVDPDANIHRFQHTDGSENNYGRRAMRRSTTCSPRAARNTTLRRGRRSTDLVKLVQQRRNTLYLQHEVAPYGGRKGYDLYVDGMPRLKSAYLAQG